MTSGRAVWVWTDDMVAELTRLWAIGDSCTQIGNAMGVSRNAVIGKVCRLGLPKRRGTTPRPMRPSRASEIRHRPPRRVRPPKMPKPPVIEIPTGKPWEAIDGIKPIGLLDLSDSTCRWPVTEDSPFLFCGAPPAHGSSYCDHHKRWSVGAGTTFEQAAVRVARSIGRGEQWTGMQARTASYESA